ncbi:MAG: preprotein translocase subunit SecE [Clostridia bacterium]|nr:preprotein translocase subunit SecE [Clostridia bacterium]
MAEEIKKNSAQDAPQKNAEKKEKKAKKPGLFKRIGNFFKEYRSEMKKVTWYPRKHVLRDTGIVVVALAVCGTAIGLLDILFSWLIIDLWK